ncbi:hypothetical protein MASR2M79_08130 [Aminivibrio sp.]
MKAALSVTAPVSLPEKSVPSGRKRETRRKTAAPPFRTGEALSFPEEPDGRSPGKNPEGDAARGDMQCRNEKIPSYSGGNNK